MSFLTVKDGTNIFYKDWGSGQPVVFSHGWPLSGDAWDNQMMYLGQRGYRVIAHDRRSHGRSDQTWDGNTMDQYADDLAQLIEHLDLKNMVMVGHSTGGGEVARYIGRHGTARVAKAVLLGAVPPSCFRVTAIRLARRWRPSTASAPPRSLIARNSSWILPRLSTTSTATGWP
jgi:non-heme chloroperoxidase